MKYTVTLNTNLPEPNETMSTVVTHPFKKIALAALGCIVAVSITACIEEIDIDYDPNADNLIPPTVSINDITVIEGNTELNEDGTEPDDPKKFKAEFTVSIDFPVRNKTDSLVVDYTTVDGTAKAGDNDYRPRNGQIFFFPGRNVTNKDGTQSFQEGKTEKKITIVIYGDNEAEANEYFDIKLSIAASSKGLEGKMTGRATIKNDDGYAIRVNNRAITEGNDGSKELEFDILLNDKFDERITVDYRTEDGTATVADNDYSPVSGEISFYPGELKKRVAVSIHGDNKSEFNETFTLKLSNISNSEVAARSKRLTATGTIISDDDSSALNDTGITKIASNKARDVFKYFDTLDPAKICTEQQIEDNDKTCEAETLESTLELFPGQDSLYGRDASQNDDSDGHAGFSFTKLDMDGKPLSANADEWYCVKDNVTGLIWENKSAYRDLQYHKAEYTWYDPTAASGSEGSKSLAECDYNGCDTHAYINAINAMEQPLCGIKQWRLPTRRALLSIVNYGTSHTAIDRDYFPYPLVARREPPRNYWTQSQSPSREFIEYIVRIEGSAADHAALAKEIVVMQQDRSRITNLIKDMIIVESQFMDNSSAESAFIADTKEEALQRYVTALIDATPKNRDTAENEESAIDVLRRTIKSQRVITISDKAWIIDFMKGDTLAVKKDTKQFVRLVYSETTGE